MGVNASLEVFILFYLKSMYISNIYKCHESLNLRKLFPGSGTDRWLCASAIRPGTSDLGSLVSKLQNGLEFHLRPIGKLVGKRLQIDVIFRRRSRSGCGFLEWAIECYS